MIALIDGDILTYRVGFASQDVDVGIATARMDKQIEDILRAVDTTEYKVFLTSTDKSNFRFKIYPAYKANRKQPKPVWYHELRAHLEAEHGAIVVSGREADDAIADEQSENTVICSIDKDLDQVPGGHYDFVKDIHYTVEPGRAERFFYFQLLTGDTTDNVPGIPGIGPKKAARILDQSEADGRTYSEAVRGAYRELIPGKPEEGEALMLLYGKLLKIGGDIWEGPVGDEESTALDSNSESEDSSNETDLSTNP